MDRIDVAASEESAALLAAIVTSSSDAILSKRLDGTITSWNESAERLFGYDARDIIGRSIRELIPGDRQGEEDEFLVRIARGERIQHYETIRLHKNKKPIEVSITISPMRNTVGKIIGASSIARDITGQKLAARALQQRSIEFEALLTSTPLGFAYFDAAHRYLRINEALAQIDGIAASEHIGRRIEELLPQNAHTIGPLIDEVFVTGKAISNYEVAGETPLKAGETRHWLTGLFPVHDHTGNIEMVGIWVAEITDRKRSESKLRESEQRFRGIFDSIYEYTGLLTPEGMVLEVNKATLQAIDVGVAEIIGKNFCETPWWAHHPDERARVRDAIDRAALGKFMQFEASYTLKEGSVGYIDLSITPVRDDDGVVVLLVPEARDVTARKVTEKALRESERFTRSVLDNLYAFVGVLTLDGTLIEANRAPLEAAGLNASDVIGKKLWESHWCSYSPAAQVQFKDAYTRAVTGESVRYDVQIRMTGDTLVWIDFQLAPLRDETGKITFLIPSGIDLTSRKQAEGLLRRSHAIYLNLIQNAPFGVYLIDANFRVAQISAGAQNVFKSVDPIIGRDFAEVMRVLWPEPFASESIAHFRQTLATGQRYRAPSLSQPRADIDVVESYDWQIERVSLLDGTYGVVCYFYDLTERQRYEEQIRLLLNEVNHRSKNLLGIVQAIARQTLASSPKEFMAHFSARIQSLSANQDLLIRNDWRGVDIEHLVNAQIAPLGELFEARISIMGPRLRLSPSAAQSIGMAIHELATNASKHGALTNGIGCVAIEWQSSGGELSISWTESGGPPVTKPIRRGFGSIVISLMVEASVNGKVELAYEPAGLRWQLKCSAANALN